MWFVSIFAAKEHVSRKTIYRERAAWLKNQEKLFEKRCKTIKRYEVVGSSPLKVFFLIETDDPKTPNVLSHHFGDAWDSKTFPVIERGIAELLKEEVAYTDGTTIVFHRSSRPSTAQDECGSKMWFVSIFDAKEHVSRKTIYRERAAWLKNQEKLFKKKCKTIKRYEVVGSSPLKVFFLIETDDPKTLNVLSHHFGDAWDSKTFPVIGRGIAELLKEEAAYTEGPNIVFRHSSRRIYKANQEKS